jgi:hypothetical protein
MKFQIMLTYVIYLFVFLSCGNKDKQTIDSTIVDNTSIKEKNYLSMKINGKDWIADNEIFAAFHPKGYNNAIIIAGNKGKKDKDQQSFNLNLFNTNGPATFNIKDGNKDFNVVQFGALSAENYLCGSMMGFEMKVIVTKASSTPDIIEATFEGKMTCSSGEILIITNGKFYYHE